jgi:hypothetical protein
MPTELNSGTIIIQGIQQDDLNSSSASGIGSSAFCFWWEPVLIPRGYLLLVSWVLTTAKDFTGGLEHVDVEAGCAGGLYCWSSCIATVLLMEFHLCATGS